MQRISRWNILAFVCTLLVLIFILPSTRRLAHRGWVGMWRAPATVTEGDNWHKNVVIKRPQIAMPIEIDPDMADPFTRHDVELGELKSPGNITDIAVEHDGRWINLTKFPHPHEVYEYAVSRDGQFAYVWHMDRPSRQLSIYDLKSHLRIANFKPGYGGSLTWTAYNTLFHRWGCGTNCVSFRIYDLHGNTKIDEAGVLGVDLSPSGRYIATFSTMTIGMEPFRILDVHDGSILLEDDGPANFGCVWDIAWDERGLIFKYSQDNGDPDNWQTRYYRYRIP